MVGASGTNWALEEAHTFVEDTQVQLKMNCAVNPEGLVDSKYWYAVVNSKTHRTSLDPTWGVTLVQVTESVLLL